MFAPSLALLERSFRVDARQMRPHLLRLLLAGLILFALLMAHLTSMIFGAPGLRLFEWIAWLNFVSITLAGVGFFATAITEEKDEETLGLLRMAGIGPVALLLGKSTTRLIAAALVLAVQLPFTLLATTLGGVTAGQIFAAYTGLLAYMVMVANLGLLCSVVASGSGRSVALTASLLLLMLAGPSFALALMAAYGTSGGQGTGGPILQAVTAGLGWLSDASMATRLPMILSTGFNEPALSFQVVSNFAAAAALFVLSWAVFELFNRGRRSSSLPGGLLTPSRRRTVGRKSRRCWSNALFWNGFNFVAGGRVLLFVKLVLYGLLVGGIDVVVLRYSSGTSTEVGATVMIVMLSLVVVELCIYSSRLFRDEVRWRIVSSLLILPVSTLNVGYSKAAGALLGVVPAAFWFLIGIVLAPESFVEGVTALFLDFPFGWHYLLQLIVLLHLTVLMSLIVKWGALPLSLGILYFSQSCLWPLMILPAMFGMWLNSPMVIMIPTALLNLGIVVCLQVFIHRRLQVLAAR